MQIKSLLIEASRYFILAGNYPCFKCQNTARVLMAGVPAGNTREGEVDVVSRQGISLLSHIDDPDPDLRQRLEDLSSHCFYRDTTLRRNITAWMNHCPHCGVVFEDYYLTDPKYHGPFDSVLAGVTEAHLYRAPIKALAIRLFGQTTALPLTMNW